MKSFSSGKAQVNSNSVTFYESDGQVAECRAHEDCEYKSGGSYFGHGFDENFEVAKCGNHLFQLALVSMGSRVICETSREK